MLPLPRALGFRPRSLLVRHTAGTLLCCTWISTLVRERLRGEDLLDLSGLITPSCAVNDSAEPAAKFRYLEYWDSAQKRNRTLPFPPNTRGFLYCHTPDPAHPAATELRFRLVSGVTGDPQAAFALGEDLLLSPGIPWRLHAISIARSRGNYIPLATLLLCDGLVSQEAMDHWGQSKTDGVDPYKLRRQIPVLCRLDQPFLYQLASR
jgi:hypothetical protein